MYFRDANVALIVFDVTNRKTLACVDYWADEVHKANADDFFIVLVGNKCDLQQKRQISVEEGNSKAKEIGALFYYETSASQNSTIQNLF
jgi:Ras-related protein Rab-6A